MKIGLALLVVLCVSCASPAPKSPAPMAGETAPPATAPVAAAQPSVIVTTDPNAVAGCRQITRTEQTYDIRQPDQWRRLQEEAARLGGNTALVAAEGDQKADIYSCSKP